MADNKVIGGMLMLSGAAIIYYVLFLRNEEKPKPSYTQKAQTPDILLNDDRTTFVGATTIIPPTNSNTVNQQTIENSIKGYPMPDDINKLRSLSGVVMIMTKADVTAFGQGGRAMFPVVLDLIGKTLTYKNNANELITEQYDVVKSKLVVPDKKYLKQ